MPCTRTIVVTVIAAVLAVITHHELFSVPHEGILMTPPPSLPQPSPTPLPNDTPSPIQTLLEEEFRSSNTFVVSKEDYGQRSVGYRDMTNEEFERVAEEEMARKGAVWPLPRRARSLRCSQSFQGGMCISTDKHRTAGNGKHYTPFISTKGSSHPLRVTVHKAHQEKVKPVICNEAGYRRMPMQGVRGATYSAPEANVLVIVLCWDTYGYHLWACVLGVKAVLYETGLAKKYPSPKIAVLKSDWAPHRMGSHQDWMTEKSYDSVHKNSNQWVLWSAVTDNPANVATLRDYSGSCFETGVVGHVPLFDVTPFHTKLLVQKVLAALHIAAPPASCAAATILFVERKQNFHIRNVNELKAALSEAFPEHHTSVAHMEDLTFVEQIRLASDAGVMIGTHGNGLTWCSFMPKGSVLVEVWGEYPYNSNYFGMAKRAAVRYMPLSLHEKGCSKRCDVTIPRTLLLNTLHTALGHHHNVSCRGAWYDPDYIEYAWEDYLLATNRKHTKPPKGVGSPPYVDSGNV